MIKTSVSDVYISETDLMIMTATESSKLIELRAKTDRQLAALIGKKLDAGLNFACQGLPLKARKVLEEAGALLPWIHESRAERRSLEEKLEQLQGLLSECRLQATAC